MPYSQGEARSSHSTLTEVHSRFLTSDGTFVIHFYFLRKASLAAH